jgi:RNA polymerase sigma-70 factor, ECF subfamily
VDKSEENCRQILRRAREAVASRRPRYQVAARHEEKVVKRFVQAASDGKWAELIDVLHDDATLVCDGSDVGQGSMSAEGPRDVAELVRQRVSRWLGDGASVQLVLLQNRLGILAWRNGKPVSSIFMSTRDGSVEAVRVITCPVRLRSLLVVKGF